MHSWSPSRSLNVLLNRIVLRMAEVLAAVLGFLLIIRLAGFLVPQGGHVRAVAVNLAIFLAMAGIVLLMRRWRKRQRAYEIGWALLMALHVLTGVLGLWVESDPLRLTTLVVLLPITGIFIHRRRVLVPTLGLLLASALLGPRLLHAPLVNPGFYYSTLFTIGLFGFFLHTMMRILLLRTVTLLERLQQARTEIHELEGFLPICAWCKAVRTDEGYWQEVEAYLHKRTDAHFTHGICPPCQNKLMAETEDGIPMDRDFGA